MRFESRLVAATLAAFTLSAGVAEAATVDELIGGMTLDEKLGQMFLAGVPAEGTAPLNVGGVIFLGGQLRDVGAVPERVAGLQSRVEVPLLIAADVEGGRVNRLNRHPELREMPSASALGRSSVEEAHAWGEAAGRVMLSLGLNLNLAPVLDVAGTGHLRDSERVYGSSPEHVATIGGAFVDGLSSAGVAAIGKHYPGYGEVSGNSDTTLLIVERPPEEFQRQREAFVGVGEGLSGVMMTNVGFTSFGSVPAPFSRELVEEAHAQGWLAMTDDLAIPALQEVTGGGPEEVVKAAFLAGNDLLLTTWPLDAAGAPDYIGALRELVQSDPSLESRVDSSVRRILNVKARIGLVEM